MSGAERGTVVLRQRSAVAAAPYGLSCYQREVIALQDSERDQGFKAAAEQAFAAACLATAAQLNGQGIIWMVAEIAPPLPANLSS